MRAQSPLFASRKAGIEVAMNAFRVVRSLVACGGVLVAAACSQAEPFVFISGEFDRGRADFGREPTDIEFVDICYNRYAITPEALREMAEGKCAAFDKKAVYRGQDYFTCPLFLPARARFDCVARR
jgi:hypothetical protein